MENQKIKIIDGACFLANLHGNSKRPCGRYVSFWPSQPGDLFYDDPSYVIQKFTVGTDVSYHRRFKYDLEHQNNYDGVESYDFFDLDIEKINEEIDTFVKKGISWKLYGSSVFSVIFRLLGVQHLNCCGVVYYLLDKGG